MRDRQLALLRHAKSSWETPADDRDRPLTERGERSARRLAEWLRGGPVQPQVVLCSPAVRAAQTLALVVPALPAKVAITHEPALYGASATQVLQRVREVPADVDSVLVVGHNPGLHDVAVALAGEGDEAAYDILRRKLPTGALVVLELDGPSSWADLRPGAARLIDFVRPSDLD